MKKIIYLFLTVSLIFSACNKEDEVVTPTIVNGCMDALATNYNSLATVDDGSCVYPAVDIRAQMVGNYTGTAVVTQTYLSYGYSETQAVQVPVVCELDGATNVHITIGEDGDYLTLNCSMITEVAGGLAFQIIETDGVTWYDCEEELSDYFILNGVGNSTYAAGSNTLDFAFEMENGSCMYEFSIIAVK